MSGRHDLKRSAVSLTLLEKVGGERNRVIGKLLALLRASAERRTEGPWPSATLRNDETT